MEAEMSRDEFWFCFVDEGPQDWTRDRGRDCNRNGLISQFVSTLKVCGHELVITETWYLMTGIVSLEKATQGVWRGTACGKA